MSAPTLRTRLLVAGLVVAVVTGSVLTGILPAGLFSAGVADADANPADPTNPATPVTVTADALPTTQIDGVAWAQVVVGTTVYVAGQFTRARPAGAAPGTQEVVRNNLLAYDITTGVLRTDFALSLNAQALSLAASPDGTRIYVGGDFTTVDGQPRNRIAAFDVASGALVAGFRPAVSSQVRAIAATNTTVYLGGRFLTLGGVSRKNIAAVTASSGALLPWAPELGVGSTAGNNLPNRPDVNTTTSTEVMALVVTGGGSQVVAGGRFDSINGVKATGVGAVDAVTGEQRPFAINQLITNQGVNSAVHSLSTDGVNVYGTAYDYYGPGNLEGGFAVTAEGGSIVWINDCQGDTYSNHPLNGALYLATHAHSCSQIGGFPEESPRINKFATAVSLAPVGTVGNGTLKNSPAWRGKPAPALQSWFPAMAAGSYTGQLQAGWSVAGNSSYVVYGGEFPRVNGVAQQGLVRYALPTVATNKVGPTYTTELNPTVSSGAPQTARVTWRTTWDQDNQNLTYDVFRSDKPTTPVYTVTAASQFWNRPTIGFTDLTVAPGATYTYRVAVRDPAGNTYRSSPVTGTVVPGTVGAYAQQVRADAPTHHWPLGDAAGSTVARDAVGISDLAVKAGVTLGTAGALGGATDTAAAVNGSTSGFAATTTSVAAPQTFSVEAWFQTTSTAGGKIIGFGDNANGLSNNHDRHVFMDAAGRLTFGVWVPTPTATGATSSISTTRAYNDGTWHHVVGTMSAGTQVLYVDGQLVGQRDGLPLLRDYNGYWKVGGDRSWSGAAYLTGTVDEVAVYPTVLTTRQVMRHAEVGRTGGPYNEPPEAVLTTTLDGATLAVDASGSSDPDGSVASYEWTFGDGASATGPTASHVYATAGRHLVTVTVTDAAGKSATGSRTVLVTEAGNPYASTVLADGPSSYWRLGESRGNLLDSAGTADLTPLGGVTLGAAGAITGDTSTAATFDGTSGYGVTSTAAVPAPQTFSLEAWVRTTSTTGGKVIGFGNNTTSLSTNYDRHITMDTAGRLTFGVFSGGKVTVATSKAYNDGTWHHVLGVSSPGSIAFYVDGQLVGTRTGVGTIQQFTGFWRVGGDSNWSGGAWFRGSIDEVAVYGTALTADQARRHAEVGLSGQTFNVPPTASATVSATGLDVSADGSASADPDGTIARTRWAFGDGTTAEGTTVSHRYTAAGTYRVVLTVTDDRGKTATSSRTIGVTAGGTTGSAYSLAVLADGATSYWRLNESGGAGVDTVGTNDLTVGTGVTRGQQGAVAGDTDRAAQFSGTSAGIAGAGTQGPAPQTFTVEAWFRTTSTTGGKIVGFGDNATGLSNSYDRHVYLDAAGRLTFGVWTPVPGNGNATTAITTATSFNDGRWHLVTGTVSPGVATFYVDGQQVGQRTGLPALRGYNGYWKAGGDRSWSGAQFLAGGIDDVAVYPTALTAEQVAQHWSKGATGLAVNKLPTAAFTATVVRRTVTVDAATSADADGRLVGWVWDFGDGTTATGATASHTYAADGEQAVRLTVTDDRGGQATVTQPVTLLPNVVPTAVATATVDDLTVSLDGSGSTDTGGTVTAWSWDLGDGAVATGRTPEHTYVAAGTYEVTLTVTDDEGATASVRVPVTVTAPNTAPTASATTSVASLEATFDGSGSTDEDGTVTSWAWTFGDGTTGTGVSPAHTYTAAGTYAVTLTVTDDRGATGTTTVDVVASVPPPVNTAPTAASTTVVTGLSVTVDGSTSTDADGSLTGWAWDFGDGTTATGSTASHTYAAAGTYEVTLTVTDDDGATGTETRPVTVAVPNLAPSAAVTQRSTALTVSLDASPSTDTDGTVVDHAWDFGDGLTGAGQVTSHTYAEEGTYQVVLTVTDDDGATGTVTTSVTVALPAAFARDTFARTTTGGLGTADVGGAWTVANGTARQSVSAGTATLALTAPTNQTGSYLGGVSQSSTDLRTTVTLSAAPTGGGANVYLTGRRVAANEEYRLRLRFLANGQVAVATTKLAGSTTETLVGAELLLPGTYTPGTALQVRLRVSGTGTTQLTGTVWAAGTTEPATPTLSRTDGTASLQVAGGVGLSAYLSGSATAPVAVLVTGLSARPVV